ncbi:MAG: tRNA glutamyl-Q(34) synthetase GluQRS [Synechococcaceae cyanobacterium]|nr:tRNA glutamyl-Q(34) synthetase GluQRS [Synechococcaceae cyanobacterium]
MSPDGRDLVRLQALPCHLRQLFDQGRALRQSGYRGRFAPSPTGPLHLGNLRTALLSWLRARLEAGAWLLRIDDLDLPRNRPGAEAAILADLAWLGLDWDPPLIRQSEHRGVYATVLSALRRQGLLYPCRCSRRLLADVSAPHGGLSVYPGTCRDRQPAWGPLQGRLPSWRLRIPAQELVWWEQAKGSAGGWMQRQAETLVGDVVLRRADGYVAYHLATAVDELIHGISEVVRGEDLSEASAAQVAVFAALGEEPPAYWHVPLWRDAAGRRLSKRQADAGVAGWRDRGGDAPGLIGFLAASLGWVPAGSQLSAQELLRTLASESGPSLRNLLGSGPSEAARVISSLPKP